MQFKQLTNKRVLIQPEERKEVTAGGIIIPDTVEQKPLFGTVLKAGDKCEYVAGGEQVLFEANAFTDFEIDGKKAKLGDEAYVIAIIGD